MTRLLKILQTVSCHFNLFLTSLLTLSDGAALGLSNEQRLKIFQEMRIMLKNCGLSTFYVPLESVINFEHNDLKEIQSETTLSINECSVSKVRKIFEDLKSVTSKEDLLIKLRLRPFSFEISKFLLTFLSVQN